VKHPSRLLELPVTERRNAHPRSLTGRVERALGWPGVGLVGFLGAGIVFTILGIVAWLTRPPWVFPSLAPTVVLMFETPLRPQASPAMQSSDTSSASQSDTERWRRSASPPPARSPRSA
jgi:hypothetical protein